MMRVWPLVLESVAMVLLWLAIVLMSMLCSIVYAFTHLIRAIALAAGLGLLHFILNVRLVSLLRGKTNYCLLVFLGLTQTTPLFLLLRRAWRSFRAGCDKNPVTKKHKALNVKYALCNETSSSSTELPDVGEEYSRRSCIPSQGEPAASTDDSTHPDSLQESPTTTPDAAESGSSSPPLEVTTTKFLPNTKTIRLHFGPEEFYAGEPKLYKFVVRRLQALYAEEKRLSYHIVVDASHAIVHASKSNVCAEELPDRVLSRDPLTVCSDIHYIVNFIKGLGYQTIGVKKRDQNHELKFVQGDLNKLVWLLVWPTTALLIFHALAEKNIRYGETYFVYSTPILGVIVWLVTQRGVDDPWRNTLILVPLRLLFTVSRTVLVCAIASTWLSIAVFAYISAKLVGLLSIAAYISYSKLVKNIEVYSDPTEMYSYSAMYEPIVQVPESVVYCCWAVWWHTYHLSPQSMKLAILLMTLISQVSGLTWLWFMRNFLKEPLHDPVQVLQMVKDREFSRT